MKPVIFIQARTGSKRLPKKVLLPLLGKSMLEQIINRAKCLESSCQIVVLTSEKSFDREIVSLCQKLNVLFFCGPEDNVLKRFYLASQKYPAHTYIRITADCPLLDPKLLKKMLFFYLKFNSCFDYLSNTLKRSYPKGFDLEIFSQWSLKKAFEEAKTDYQKEHVTPYMYQNPSLFKCGNYLNLQNLSSHNFSVDTLDDFLKIKFFYEKYFHINPIFGLEEIKHDLQKKELDLCKSST